MTCLALYIEDAVMSFIDICAKWLGSVDLYLWYTVLHVMDNCTFGLRLFSFSICG